jgi:hypothetical protein
MRRAAPLILVAGLRDGSLGDLTPWPLSRRRGASQLGKPRDIASLAGIPSLPSGPSAGFSTGQACAGLRIGWEIIEAAEGIGGFAIEDGGEGTGPLVRNEEERMREMSAADGRGSTAGTPSSERGRQELS